MGEITRAAIVAEARSWIGTPYRHQASCKGAGCDCLGLVRGVWRRLYGAEPEAAPPYTPDWAEQSAAETLRDAAARHLDPVEPKESFRAGDVLIFRFRESAPAKHAAIASGPASIIHAYDRHAVMESALPEPWLRRLAFAFRFPGVRD